VAELYFEHLGLLQAAPENSCGLSRAPPCRAIPPVDLIQPRRQRRADEQIVMSAARGDAPAQQLPRSRQDLIGAGRELMSVDPRHVGAVVNVLLDPTAIDQSDEGPAEIALALAGGDERLHDHPPRSVS
jgi:hypothetical protein